MQFEPDILQKRILRALNRLEIEGCSSATPSGEPCPPRITFSAGVPAIVLQAWVGAANEQFQAAITPLARRGLVREIEQPCWPIPGNTCSLARHDRQIVLLRWNQTAGAQFLEQFATSIGAARVSTRPDAVPGIPKEGQTPSGFFVEARVGSTLDQCLAGKPLHVAWMRDGKVPAYTIERPGLELLDLIGKQGTDQKSVTLGLVASTPARSAEELLRPLLEALQYMEFRGVALTNANPTLGSVVLRFGAGTPRTLLRAWLDVLPPELLNAIRYGERMGLLKVRSGDLVQAFSPSHFGVSERSSGKRVFARPDGKSVLIKWEPAPGGGYVIIASAGEFQADGSFAMAQPMPTFQSDTTEMLVQISGEGLKWLERLPSDAVAPSFPIRELDAYLGKVFWPEVIRLREAGIRTGTDLVGISELWKKTEPLFLSANGAVRPESAKLTIHQAREACLMATIGLSTPLNSGLEPVAAAEDYQRRIGDLLSKVAVARAALRPWFEEPAVLTSGAVTDSKDAATKAGVAVVPPGPVIPRNFFQREGDCWVLQFVAEDGTIENPPPFPTRVGFEHIRGLIYDAASLTAEFPTASIGEPVTDEKTLAQVRARNSELLERREIAGFAEREDIDDEIKAGQAYIAERTIPGGKLKTEATEWDRAIKRFRKNVNSALDYARRYAPKWAAHMQTHIQYGGQELPRYSPNPPVAWSIPED